MDRQNETVGVLVGLGLGLFIGLVGVIGTAGAFGYAPVAIILAGLVVLAAVALASGVATSGRWLWASMARTAAPAVVPAGGAAPVTMVSPERQPVAEPLEAWLGRAELFGEMTAPELERIQQIAVRRRLPSGETLARERSPQEHLYVVMSGQVRLSARSRQGDTTVRIAGPGEAFPVACLLKNPVAVTTARTVSEVDALVIPRDALLELCLQQPEIGMHLFRAVASILLRRYRATLDELSGNMRSVVDLVAV